MASAAEAPISEGMSDGDLRIQRDHRGHDLHFVEEAIREQRTNGAIDQARGQGFAFAGPAFATEESTGNAAGRVSLFLVVDGQREEILAGLRLLARDGSDQDHGVAHRDND